MSRVVASVLDRRDLPLAELCAARLDGEVYAVDDCFAALDEVNATAVRAAAVARTAPHRTIAELDTALWIYAVLQQPPARHRFCVDVAERARTPLSSRFIVRECVIRPGDVRRIAGTPVTSPLRTAVDILRMTARFRGCDRWAVSELLRLGELGIDECETRLRAQPSAPGNRRALERLAILSRLQQGTFGGPPQLSASAGAYPVHVVNGVDPANGVQHAIQVSRIPHLEHEPAQRQPLAGGRDGCREDVHVVLGEHAGDVRK